MGPAIQVSCYFNACKYGGWGRGKWGQNHIVDDDDDVWSYGHVSYHGNGQRGPVATDRNTK